MVIDAIIPARGGSKGLPRKNTLEFQNEPLIVRTIRVAIETEIFRNVIVSTEDSEIAGLASEAGAFVLQRPSHMAEDSSEIDPLMTYILGGYAKELKQSIPDILTLLYCTAPLRTASDIVETVSLVENGKYNSALTLVEDHSYIWKIDQVTKMAVPENYQPSKRAARQTENWNQWIENKAVYAFKTDKFLETGCRIIEPTGWVEMPALRSIDIDTKADFIVAELIANLLGAA